MIFINTVNPYLRVLIQQGEHAGEYAQFLGGKLELDEGDPGFADVKAEAGRNPNVVVLVNETTCGLCGEVFTGKAAKAQLGTHVKANHPLVWDAQKALEAATTASRTIKERAGYPCDVCSPVQTFGDEAGLAQHARDFHTQPPEMDDEGNETGTRRPGETAIPVAHSTS
jgi:hypothetical protein